MGAERCTRRENVALAAYQRVYILQFIEKEGLVSFRGGCCVNSWRMMCTKMQKSKNK